MRGAGHQQSVLYFVVPYFFHSLYTTTELVIIEDVAYLQHHSLHQDVILVIPSQQTHVVIRISPFTDPNKHKKIAKK